MHRELCHAYTTAAIYNLLGAPEEWILESSFMPNLTNPSTKTDEKPLIVSVEEIESYKSHRAHIGALLEAYSNTGVPDQQLIDMGLVGNG